MNIQNKIEEFFIERGNVLENSDNEKFSIDYLAMGILDSLGLVELISFIENTLDVTFSQDDLESKEFRTINGLANIVQRDNSTLK